MARLALPALAAAVAAGGCMPGGGQDGQWPPAPPVVRVTLDEYGFAFDEPVPAGRVLFEFTNAGGELHDVNLLPLPEDVPPIDEQLRGDERRQVPNFAEVQPLQPAEEGVFAVDLESGRRYALICFQIDDADTPHAVQGMNAEFRAGGPDADPPDHDPGD